MENKLTPRAKGTNPRALGTNPRAQRAIAPPLPAPLVEWFPVTRDWLHAHATAGHGWTRAQLALLGVDWPPVKGWSERLVGVRLTPEQRRRFEAAGAARNAVLVRRSA